MFYAQMVFIGDLPTGRLSGIFPVKEGDEMNLKTEKRSAERYPHEGAITFSIFNQQNCIDAQSLDYSKNGLKFRSTCSLRPGSTICIRVKSGRRRADPDRLNDSFPPALRFREFFL
jgi:hypothetical protein